jgi:hypothetical protein
MLMVVSHRVLMNSLNKRRRRRMRQISQPKILQISSRLLPMSLSSRATPKATKLKRLRLRDLIMNLPTLVPMLTSKISMIIMAATFCQRDRLSSQMFRFLNSKINPNQPLKKKKQSMRRLLLLKLRALLKSTFRIA